jgi:hypothetical protein
MPYVEATDLMVRVCNSSAHADNNKPGGTTAMAEESNLKYLSVALVVIGIVFLGVYPLMNIWPSGFAWHTGHSDYPMMIVGIYATLGVFLILAARNPLAHLSLIWFTVWSSLVHAVIMLFQSFERPENHGHLLGDVPALLIVAVVLAILTPKGQLARSLQRATAH